jgi:hypothetical protein
MMGRALTRRMHACIAGCVAAYLMVNPALAAKCATGAQQAALEARVLQTELMVMALSCQEHSRYNHFVTKFQTELVKHGTDLRNFFNQTYGAQGQQRLNKFVTELANLSSQRSLARTDQFCNEVRSEYDVVLALPTHQLSSYAAAHPFARTHGIPDCASHGGVTTARKQR